MTDTFDGVTPFDVCGDLPKGTTVLEASAGTGKTYTIAALAARYVAEGHAELAELMLVTFGRMATNELRLRVRERLISVEQRLAEVLDGRPPATPADRLEGQLTTGTPAELAHRHHRVTRALADFDAATIATTHEFCLRMLDELGVLGDSEPQAVFVENVSELTREVASDVYLRRYAVRDEPPPMSAQAAQQLALDVLQDEARLVPAVPHDSGEAAERLAFAEEVREEVRRRKVLARVFTYDDMLTRLRDALRHPVFGPAAIERLRQRYRIVLVDEFQDTDPVQWDILRRAFSGHATLVLIGDPKQAIYAFRGADVFSYLAAVAEADRVATLSTNWRSDADLAEGLDRLMGGAALGDERIVVRPVTAHHRQRRLAGAAGTTVPHPQLAPVRVRVVPHEPEADRPRSVTVLRPEIAQDLVADVTRLLASGPLLHVDSHGRPITPADIAVLVRRNDRAEELRGALVGAGVPAVVLGATSVYSSSIAEHWLTLLAALEQPRSALVREAALTCFLGWSFSQLVAADDDEVTELTQRVRFWSRVVRTRGVAALLETITMDTRLPERMLGQVGGDRDLTDLRHLSQNLHAAMVAGQLGLGALVAWLRDRIAESQASAPTEGLRRLETDAASVQILTVHRSKGLEFPIVYLPEAWDRHVNTKDSGATLRLHEGNERVLDVGGVTAVARNDRLAQWRREEDAEDLRLLYVGLTRAQCQVVTWWAPSNNTPASALHRFLYKPRRLGAQPEAAYEVSGDPLTGTDLGPGISMERIEARVAEQWQAQSASSQTLAVRTFDRPLDLDWRRTSYSALTSAVHGLDLSPAGVGSEVESSPAEDEVVSSGAVAAPVPPVADAELARPSPMSELPGGVAFGTVVHAVLESLDLEAKDLAGELRRAVTDQLSRTPPSGFTVEALSSGLLPALLTPLGPLADGLRLADVQARDRLSELSFELPLAGGEQITTEVRLGHLAPVLRAHLPATDPLAPYPDLLEHPLLAEQSLRGYLTGSIDAVLRVRSGDRSRYLVVDYKTNWLGGVDAEDLTLAHYTAPRLAEAMMAAHYPLQALLYSVAVHRFLRWRQPGYDPVQHLGGVLYLFVRGMAGPDTPVIDGMPCGVFSWRPPPELVGELSDLLEGRR
ncbi:MAG TPA: UvrD-helicase domain-containing protein [Propionibacteriaceae bacterium]|nr:UvrD-helicase domain-containing protein [Propionibacteriaceae bacterium]